MNALHLPLDPMAPIMAPWMSRLHGNTQAPEVSSGLRVNPDDVAGPSGDSANGPGRTQPPEETARPHHGVEASSSSGRSLMSFWDDNEDDNEEADLAILEGEPSVDGPQVGLVSPVTLDNLMWNDLQEEMSSHPITCVKH